MNNFLPDSIEQLDLALDQLSFNDSNFDRFAFLLIDNVVELTLHNFVENRKNTRKINSSHDALGRYFKPKIKAVHDDFNLINGETYDSIFSLHKFRNEAHHVGIKYEGILHLLAFFYFSEACKLLKSYAFYDFNSLTPALIPYRAKKYIGDFDDLTIFENIPYVFDKLDSVADSIRTDLVNDLAENMFSIIENTEDDINNIAVLCADINESIIEAQAMYYSYTDEGKQRAYDLGFTNGNYDDYIEWLKKNESFSYIQNPIPNSWKKRYQSLLNESNPHKALKKYFDFVNQTEYIRTVLEDISTLINNEIQDEVDQERGK